MARTPTTLDPFNAIAEPKRRQLLEILAGKELTVSQIVAITAWKQPSVSKHLNVLKQVGLVTEHRDGRHKLYKINGAQLKTIQLWVGQFEKYWSKRLDQLDQYLNKIQKKEVKDE